MAMRPVDLILLGIAFGITGSGDAAYGLSTAIKPLLDCRQVADRDARLACFDREASAIEAAIDRREVVVADNGEITKARRSLFGLASPGVDIFNKDRSRETKAEPGVNAIDGTIARVSQDPYGHWIMILDDDSRWVQIDEEQIPREPKKGMPIHIRRAAMGSFLANVDKQIGIRVRRVN